MRLFLFLLLVAVSFPAVAAVYGALGRADGGGLLAWSSGHLPLVWTGSALAAVTGLLVVERPRSTSARAYVAQLRSRFVAVQRDFELALEAAERNRRDREITTPSPDGSGAVADALGGPAPADVKRR